MVALQQGLIGYRYSFSFMKPILTKVLLTPINDCWNGDSIRASKEAKEDYRKNS